jgi:hypothetical protein
MQENEILEVELEMNNGNKIQMKIQLQEDWSEIEKDTRSIIFLINGEQLLVDIIEADEDNGVTFKFIGSDRMLNYNAPSVAKIYTEVKD